jgi:hypothetical protein
MGLYGPFFFTIHRENSMAKKAPGANSTPHVKIVKRTSQGSKNKKPKTSSMNKNKRSSYKKYRGQG